MCGIFGVLYRDGVQMPDEGRLAATARLLGHRGPDSVGMHAEPGIGLVQSRLALVDLTDRARQPFWDEERRFALVYNGEIYNYQVLREELSQRGVPFRTTSDTEVLLQAIRTLGLDATLPRLEGMFAFALWDSRERSLVLVRDRFGIKPLAVWEDDERLVFASEIKAIQPWIELAPDPHVISAYLAGFGGPTRDRSFFRGVDMLAPGAIREQRVGEASRTRSYFRMPDFWDAGERERLARLGPKQTVDHFEALLFESVRKHLIADAPVGALCSGGLDSSLVMAMASRHHSNLAIFHADVCGPLSEAPAARALADHLRLDMKVVQVVDSDFVERMPEVVWHYEYPFAHHPNSVPFLLVSHLVRASGVKAILSGEGSDECFLGYGSIATEDFRRAWARGVARVARAVQRVPGVGKLLWPAHEGFEAQVLSLETNLETAADADAIAQRMRELGENPRPRDTRSLEWLGYHLRTLLHRNDSLGMAASIEARFPYLDHDVVRAAVNLGYRYKIRPTLSALDRSHPFLRDKWVVRSVADRYVPRVLSQRRKLGFPTNAYERMRVSPEIFASGFAADFYRLASRELSLLLRDAPPRFVVRLLLLEVWGRLFMGSATPAQMVDALRAHTRIEPAA